APACALGQPSDLGIRDAAVGQALRRGHGSQHESIPHRGSACEIQGLVRIQGVVLRPRKCEASRFSEGQGAQMCRLTSASKWTYCVQTFAMRRAYTRKPSHIRADV